MEALAIDKHTRQTIAVRRGKLEDGSEDQVHSEHGCILLFPQAGRHVSPTLRLLGVWVFFFVFYLKYFLSPIFFLGGGYLVLCSFPKSQLVC